MTWLGDKNIYYVAHYLNLWVDEHKIEGNEWSVYVVLGMKFYTKHKPVDTTGIRIDGVVIYPYHFPIWKYKRVDVGFKVKF